MMNEEEFRAKLRDWISRNAPESLKNRKILFETVEFDDYTELRQWQRRLYESGYLGITWPKEYGGQGLDPIYEIALWKEFRLNRFNGCCSSYLKTWK